MRSYDTEGSGEMAISELASAMGEVVGLTKEDVMPMFSQSGKLEDVSLDSKNDSSTTLERSWAFLVWRHCRLSETLTFTIAVLVE